MTEQYKLIFPLAHTQPVKQQGKSKKSKAPKTEAGPSTINENIVPVEVTETTVRNVQQQKRPTLPSCNNAQVLLNIDLVKSYLHETGVSIAMKKLTVEILQNQVLPYNPYYTYIKHMRKLAEKFHIKQKTLAELKQDVSKCLTFQASSGVLSGVKGNEMNIWGLKHVLSTINPKILMHFSSIINDCYVSDTVLKEKCGKDTSFLVSLSGPFLFTGSTYPNIFQIDLSMNVVILSSNEETVYKLFCQSILEDIKHTINHDHHCFVKLEVFYMENNVQRIQTWLHENIINILDNPGSEIEFTDKIIEGLLNNAPIETLSIIKSDTSVSKTSGIIPYLPMKKKYHLTSLLSASNDRNASVKYVGMSSTLSPYQDVHEGVYFERSKVESYLSMLKKQTSAKTPLYAPVLSNMKTMWKDVISKTYLQEDFIGIGHLMYMLDKVQNISKTSSALVEADFAIQFTRICNGSAFKLLTLVPLNDTLCCIAQLKENCPEKMKTAFNSLLQTYSRCLIEKFYLHDYSTDVTCTRDSIFKKIEEIKKAEEEKQYQSLEKALNFLDGYTKAMAAVLLSDAVDQSNVINSMKFRINEDMCVSSPSAEVLGIDVNPNSFVHNLRNTYFLNVDVLSLDLNKCAMSGTAPKNVAKETVMMQYCADMHIDNIWEEYLNTLFFDKSHLPPNPFPQLVSLLRKGSLKVQLFRESDLNIVKRFLQNKIKLCDASQQIFTISGLQAFGLLSTIKIVNLNGYRQIQSIVGNLATVKNENPDKATNPIQMKKFEIKCLTSLSSETLFYGSASPFLCSFNLNEHCFIRGPNHSEHSGITMLARVVVDSIKQLISESVLPCEAIFGNVKLDITDFNNLESRFIDDFVSNVNESRKCQIILLVKFDWKYVQVKKDFYVYYINENTERLTKLVKLTDISKSFQVFFNLHDAVYFYKKDQITINKSLLDKNLKRAWENEDWVDFACLISNIALNKFETNGKLSDSDYSSLAFTWRYFHSTAGVLHYCNSLAQSLQYAILHLSYNETNTAHSVIEKMMIGFKHKLNIALNAPSALTPSILNVMLHRKLNNFCRVDVASQTMTIFNVQGLINTLSYISSILRYFQDTTFYELVKISERIKEIGFIN